MLDLEEIIQRRFPEDLSPLQDFEPFFDRLLDEVRGPAMEVMERLETQLEESREHLQQREGMERDHWVLFAETAPVKSAKSARSKVAREIEEEDDALAGARLTAAELRARTLGFGDLARCRVVCTLNQDVYHLHDQLIFDDRFLKVWPLRSSPKDFVFEPRLRRGLLGHRARQFSAWITTDTTGERFGFEVQLMTTLQHAWDRRNHPLYEQIREGQELPPELRVNDFACSETLHLVDQQSEQNWNEFLTIMRPK